MSPDGHTHSALRKEWRLGAYCLIGLIAAIAMVSLGRSLTFVALFPLLAWIGYEMGDMISPDLDGIGITNSESLMMKWLGPLGALYAGYWILYAWIIRFAGGHRSWLSHGPFIGTATRVVFGFWWISFVWWYRLLPDEVIYIVLLGLYLGLAISDIIHWAADRNHIR